MEWNISRSHRAVKTISTAAAVLALAALSQAAGQAGSSAPPSAKLPQSLRLYVFDGGILENMDPGRFQLKKEDVSTSRMSVPCFLIAHPKGTLIWDAGAVPDAA